MIIDHIYLQNFRSYDSEGITLPFSPRVNAIIGENNVGKTTIIAALKKILILESEDSSQDYFARDITKELKISIKCIFDDSEISQLISALSLPYDINEFLTFFSNEVEYTYIRIPGKAILKIRIGFLYLETGGIGNSCIGYLDSNHTNDGYPGVPWHRVTDQITNDEKRSLKVILDQLSEEFFKTNPTKFFSIEFQTNVGLTIISLIKSKIILLDEFREKPQTTVENLSSNTTGKELITELYNLKMGEDITDRNNYSKIQKQFKQLYPHLEMDIIQTGTNYQIEIRKENIVSTTFFIGSGILQTLFLLTHIYAHPKTILFIDTPELQLHPHIQRRIGSLFKSFQGGQIIILTHSQYFLTISKGFQLVRLIQEHGKTRALYSNEGFTDEDYNVFDQMLTIDNMEFFFSRFVLLVEGLSDQ
jgi:predicted ATP-dependent endonuclease of OLD family